MNTNEKPAGIEEIAINPGDLNPPLAPYWEGETLAEGLNIPLNRKYNNDSERQYTKNTYYQKGYIDYKGKVKTAKQKLWDNVIIGYRSDTPWHPQDFL